MMRRAFHFLSSFSLLLLAGMSVICLSGVYLGSVRTIGWMATFTNRDGNVGIAIFVDETRDPAGGPLEPWKTTEVVRVNALRLSSGRGVILPGLALTAMPLATPGPTGYTVFIGWPWWSAALALLPTIRLVVWGRRRLGRLRQAHGRCANCDYDLRASPGRCPECGAVPRASN